MPRVLLVDDSATDRALMQGILQREQSLSVDTCANGREALELIGLDQPDVVVTDMRMPDMDGLELVKEVRQAYPTVPVVLLTGQGSEELAAKALRAGAAGYVPKSQSNEQLRDTVRRLLEYSLADANYQRLLEASSRMEFEFVLENDPQLIPPLVELTRRMLGSMGICDATGELQVAAALEHAIRNSILHGNLELGAEEIASVSHGGQEAQDILARRNATQPYSERRIQVTIRLSRDEFRCTVKDDGDGFDVKQRSTLGLSTTLTGESGQGLFLMWAFMDQVSFSPTGNAVTLVKKAQPKAPVVKEETPLASRVPKSSEPELLAVLTPKDGNGEPIKITRNRATFGRDPSCDIAVRSSSVSQHHGVLYLHKGWFYVKDLHSRNGTRVNGVLVSEKILPPNSTLSVGRREFKIEYKPHELGAEGITPPIDPF